MKFLDEVKIYVESGHGGPGCVSFRREKFIEYGGPDGGNGGKGGNVYITAVSNLNTLIDYRYQQHFKAGSGNHGMGAKKTGKNGSDIFLKVPIGTQIYDNDKETLLLDMVNENEQILFLEGGIGGLGNEEFKSSINKAPRYAQQGLPGVEKWIWMRLKLIADIGIIGLPNAGKSTFLSVISNARPKIGDYPFTTLHPNLGCAYLHDQEMIFCDIPGLIEGAHEGVGLGHKFLGHIERCRALLHLIDANSNNIAKDYQMIRNELMMYSNDLCKKKEIVAINKIDCLDQETINEKLKELKSVYEGKIYTLSGIAKIGLNEILTACLPEKIKSW